MRVAQLKKKVLIAQVNVWVEEELKARLGYLKDAYEVDTPEEIRTAIREHVSRLEKHYGVSPGLKTV
jgi:hypothetical protein